MVCNAWTDIGDALKFAMVCRGPHRKAIGCARLFVALICYSAPYFVLVGMLHHQESNKHLSNGIR